ncbi:DUF6985 domain-containing protein [Cetobacterium sp. SF1]|uniref:DUF6985 domain-containing protein n=1 Tax=Cetobacterium sp. SF1 TaxID=3417654 RepID=UPI003CE984F2
MTVKNSIVGDLTYDYGWRKKEEITFWNRREEVEINFIAYGEEKVNSTQEEEYTWLKNNLLEVEKNSLEEIKEYISEEYKLNYSEEKIMEEIRITEIIFERDEESIGLVFQWDYDLENGIGVRIKNKSIFEIGFESMVM